MKKILQFILIIAVLFGGVFLYKKAKDYKLRESQKNAKMLKELDDVKKDLSSVQKDNKVLSAKIDQKKITTVVGSPSETKAVSDRLKKSEDFLLKKLIDVESKVDKKLDSVQKSIDEKCTICKVKKKKKKLVKKKTKPKTYSKKEPRCFKREIVIQCIEAFEKTANDRCRNKIVKTIPRSVKKTEYSREKEISKYLDVKEEVSITEITHEETISEIKDIDKWLCSDYGIATHCSTKYCRRTKSQYNKDQL
jgi:hypothetical protein